MRVSKFGQLSNPLKTLSIRNHNLDVDYSVFENTSYTPRLQLLKQSRSRLRDGLDPLLPLPKLGASVTPPEEIESICKINLITPLNHINDSIPLDKSLDSLDCRFTTSAPAWMDDIYAYI